MSENTKVTVMFVPLPVHPGKLQLGSLHSLGPSQRRQQTSPSPVSTTCGHRESIGLCHSDDIDCSTVLSWERVEVGSLHMTLVIPTPFRREAMADTDSSA